MKLLDAVSHLDASNDMIEKKVQSSFSPEPLIMVACFCPVCMRVCVCAGAYLAVEVRGVYTGFDDIE